jgi:diguanylate cyclase (GGDEF)-like protein
MSSPLTFAQAITPLLHWLMGPDRATRSRVTAVGLCTLVYMLCCFAAKRAAEVGVMQAWAVPVLVSVTIPCCLLVLVLVRSGWSRHRKDPSLMIPQNILALCAIALAYIAVGPDDRGLVSILLTLVIVFGMYAHTPGQTLMIGGTAMLLMGGTMAVLSHVNPALYPPLSELIRFELLAGCVPMLVYTAHQLAVWRDRLRLQRAELTEAVARVQHLATRDTLTGLINRRHMQDKLEEAVQRLDRYGERFSVALIDLDHFKRINDQFGHQVGDEVLVAFAHAASAALRDSDTLARWGGEEFLVLFPDTMPEHARQPLLRLQEELAQRSVSATVPGLRVSFSAGLSLHIASATLDHSLERADAALYEAKRLGRSKVMIAAQSGGDGHDAYEQTDGLVAHDVPHDMLPH